MNSTTSHKLKVATLRKIDSDYPLVVEVATRNIPKVRARISGDIMQKYLSEWQVALDDRLHLKQWLQMRAFVAMTCGKLILSLGYLLPKSAGQYLRQRAQGLPSEQSRIRTYHSSCLQHYQFKTIL